MEQDRTQDVQPHQHELAREPLFSHEVVVNLIASTTTGAGLKIEAEIDTNTYPKGIQVTDEELEKIKIQRADFHGEWNYTILPTS